VQFYRWLSARGPKSVPQGPSIWICGDCHAGNLGPLASADGKIHVQIRDLDQTVIGNPNHDLIRLALSLASAARGSDLPGVTTAHMLEEMIIGYRRALRNSRAQNIIESDKPECIKIVIRRAFSRTWKHLAKERIEDVKPKIPKGERFWPLAKLETKAIEELFGQEPVRRLVTSLESRPDDDPRYAASIAAQTQKAAMAVLGKGLAPVHRKAVLNAKRLSKFPLRCDRSRAAGGQ
jgi:uncharacterized protein (DUF2252 family)